MICSNVISSVTIDCLNSQGGIDSIKVKNFDSALTNITVTSGVASMSGSALTGWKTFECEPETSAGNEAPVTDNKTATYIVPQTITYVNNKLKASFRNTLNSLHGMRLHVLVKDNNGSVWLFGYERGMITSASQIEFGAAYTDRNGYTVTFSGREKQPAISVSTAWASFIDA